MGGTFKPFKAVLPNISPAVNVWLLSQKGKKKKRKEKVFFLFKQLLNLLVCSLTLQDYIAFPAAQ